MLDKKYNHLEVEKDKYKEWLNHDFFKSGDLKKEPFCIVIPPPNVTGKLHLGHAWDTSLQDIVIRYKRMQGYDALWLPGMDHAGVATQAKIDARLRSNGINPKSLTREEWMKKAWSWKEEYASIIREQWAKLGLSLDYSKERFTMDEGLNNAVNKVFVDLYNKGLVYRGTKPINWDPIAKTALSNIEVIYKKEKGKMYYLKYMFPNSCEYLEVATTRLETLASDTAVSCCLLSVIIIKAPFSLSGISKTESSSLNIFTPSTSCLSKFSEYSIALLITVPLASQGQLTVI